MEAILIAKFLRGKLSRKQPKKDLRLPLLSKKSAFGIVVAAFNKHEDIHHAEHAHMGRS